MTNAIDILTDAFGRVQQTLHSAVEGLTADQLAARPDGRGNSVAWLAWHLARVQDDHIADAAGSEQVWTSQGFAGRMQLPFDDAETGYGFSPEQVAQVRPEDPQVLLDYLDAVHGRTVGWLAGVTEADLDRVVDENFDPPVTLAVRLVSIISDDLQHVGQAAYVAGLSSRS
ncbi:DinB family protein [Motilibacter peucedani]|uniref:DinB family protein n=1 Tax=Motilibacter peucedani TaxID=598650 RepID=A0A420XPN3_9ACTN|nr:DinB family protein [Motilibacter peucedani]RKS74126.1 DinB family protein [Motilibacter peucedani]